MKPYLLFIITSLIGSALISLQFLLPALYAFVERVCVQKFGELNANSRGTPLIFIGGVPRSGTTLMRVLLDAHADVRCGEETFVLSKTLRIVADAKNMFYTNSFLEMAGVGRDVFDGAIASFILSIVRGHGADARRLCNKDPLTLSYSGYLAELFPRAKFVLMLRDGRAVAHSIIKSNILELTGLRNASATSKWAELVGDIVGLDLRDYGKALKMWNELVVDMLKQCCKLGEKRCLLVRYEWLVVRPEEEMRRILEFLELPWDESVLHHERLIGKEIFLSELHPSSAQARNRINADSIFSWAGKIPEDVLLKSEKLAPMLKMIGVEPGAERDKLTNPWRDSVCARANEKKPT